ncbi:MAG: lactate racemase domain-containing protein, partial [Desulfuromonadales bacterium]|nr:lactate racemase domain-containing protein [Desulfuromonadales bacterium]
MKYGTKVLQLELQTRLVTAKAPQNLPDPTTEIHRALANPLGTPTLLEIVGPGERVVIVTSDITRYTGS